MEKEFQEGSIIEIEGEEGLVLSIEKDDEKEFAVVSFGDVSKKVEVDAFEIVRKNDELYFKDLKDEELKANILAAFAIKVCEEQEI